MANLLDARLTRSVRCRWCFIVCSPCAMTLQLRFNCHCWLCSGNLRETGQGVLGISTGSQARQQASVRRPMLLCWLHSNIAPTLLHHRVDCPLALLVLASRTKRATYLLLLFVAVVGNVKQLFHSYCLCLEQQRRHMFCNLILLIGNSF